MSAVPRNGLYTLAINNRPVQCQLLDVSIAFFDGRRVKSRSLKRRILHYVTTCLTNGGYTHCELVFRVAVSPPVDGRREAHIGCAMEWRAPLALDFRTYENDLWRWCGLAATGAQLDALFRICLRDVERQLYFNLWGFLWNFVAPSPSLYYDAKGERAFCSEHVLLALREAGIAPAIMGQLEACATHPHQLWAHLKAAGALNNIVCRPRALEGGTLLALPGDRMMGGRR